MEPKLSRLQLMCLLYITSRINSTYFHDMPNLVQNKEAVDVLMKLKLVTYKFEAKPPIGDTFKLAITPTKKGHEYANSLLLPMKKV